MTTTRSYKTHAPGPHERREHGQHAPRPMGERHDLSLGVCIDRETMTRNGITKPFEIGRSGDTVRSERARIQSTQASGHVFGFL